MIILPLFILKVKQYFYCTTNLYYPTGNLDSKTSQEVLGLLKLTGEQFQQTIVMITHNDAMAQLADRVIRIEDGKIAGGRRYEK